MSDLKKYFPVQAMAKRDEKNPEKDDHAFEEDTEEESFSRLSWEKGNERVESMFALWKRGRLNLSPIYQRDDVWSLPNRQELIKTLVDRGGYIPAVVLSRQQDSMKSINVVDGKQRLTTLFMFMNNEFKYKNRYFSELTQDQREQFNDIRVDSVSYDKLHFQQELEIFQVLQRGVALSTGEKLRACQDVAIICAINDWIETSYKDLFPRKTSAQKKRHDNYKNVVIAVIMIGTSGKTILSAQAQLVWLQNVSPTIKNLESMCTEALGKVAQIQLSDPDFYKTLTPVEIIYLIYLMSMSSVTSTVVLKERAARIHKRLVEKKIYAISRPALTHLQNMWAIEQAGTKRARVR